MKSAIKTSEESWIEQQMLEDKKRATDWEATNEAIDNSIIRHMDRCRSRCRLSTDSLIGFSCTSKESYTATHYTDRVPTV